MRRKEGGHFSNPTSSGTSYVPESLSQLVAWFSELGMHNAGWRGQADITWPIHSSLARRVSCFAGKPRTGRDALEHAMRGAEPGSYRTGTPSRARQDRRARPGRTRDPRPTPASRRSDEAARLQSQLLFRRALVRLPDKPKDTGLLIGFDLGSAHQILSVEAKRPLPTLLKTIGAGYAWWQPSALSPRIPAQQGFFIFSRAHASAQSSLRFSGEHYQHAGNVPGAILIAVRPKLKDEMAGYWRPLFGYLDEQLPRFGRIRRRSGGGSSFSTPASRHRAGLGPQGNAPTPGSWLSARRSGRPRDVDGRKVALRNRSRRTSVCHA